MTAPHPSVSDPLPPGCERIELRLSSLKQLFNSMDASPFRERDLDPGAEEFIVGWAREAQRDARLALILTLDHPHAHNAPDLPELSGQPAAIQTAVAEFFTHRAKATRARLQQLLSIGRTSLLVGVVFLVAAVGLAGLAAGMLSNQRLGELLREGLVICGWVAMWHPLEIFLYGWWPIRREARLYDRLSRMPVAINYGKSAEPGAWQRDWPAVSPSYLTPQKPPTHAALLRSNLESNPTERTRSHKPDDATSESVLP